MRKKLEHTNPIKITIPQELYSFLKQDADNFEVYKSNEEQFVMNYILSPLIAGYFERYREKISGQYRRMQKLLCSYIGDSDKLDAAIKQLIEDKAQDEAPELKGGKTRHISIRPTAETDDIISQIDQSMQETNETVAGYYRRMLYSYSALPMYERERIIYYKTVSTLERACADHEELVLSVGSKKNNDHRVMPYKVVHGLDERYNYLLCQEYDEEKEKLMAVSFRLSRINPRRTYTYGNLDPKVKGFLEKMEEHGPQYSINEYADVSVELNEAGRRDFRRIYQGRPIKYRKDKADSHGVAQYHFSCSLDQLFLYFRRFNPGGIKILNSDSINMDLLRFHSRHVAELEKQGYCLEEK